MKEVKLRFAWRQRCGANTSNGEETSVFAREGLGSSSASNSEPTSIDYGMSRARLPCKWSNFQPRERKLKMKTTLRAMLITATLLASASGSFAASFMQASSNEEQLATDTKPNVVRMIMDTGAGITNRTGVATIHIEGVYFLMAAAQVGGKAAGSVRLWIKVNGKNVVNSNTEQVIPDASFTAVLVSQGVLMLKDGDTVEVVYSGSAPGLGLIVKKPEGEPVVPSIIFSAFKVN
jgi:hypothetical protein